MSALQHFEAAQAALQTDDFKAALKHFQAASDAEAEVTHMRVLYGNRHHALIAEMPLSLRTSAPTYWLSAECGVLRCSRCGAC